MLHSGRTSDFPFSKFVNFRFTFEQIPFDIQKLSIFYRFLATFTPNYACIYIAVL